MKKRSIFFCLMLFLCLFFNTSGVKALEMSVDTYEKLKDAILNDDVTEIKLTGDIVIDNDTSLVIGNDKKLIIDLNGKVLSMESEKTSSSSLITNKGKLTIKDSTDSKNDGNGFGKISFSSSNPDMKSIPSYASNTISNNGEIILESGIIENSTKSAPAAYVIDNLSGSTDAKITINGGKLNSVNNWGIRMFANSITKNNDVIINGGYIVGGLWIQTLRNQSKANLIINDGKLEGKKYGLYIYDPYDGSNVNVKINGGEIIATKENGFAIYDFDTGANFEINSGTFTGDTAFIYFTYNKSNNLTHYINGGIFNGYVELDQKFTTNPNEEYESNLKITNGKFLKDVSNWAYDGNDWYFSTNSKFINGGEFATIVDGEDDCAWLDLIVSPYVATGKMKSLSNEFPYTIGNKVILNPNYENSEVSLTYSLKDGSMVELEDIKRDGYNFIEWNTKADGTGDKITKSSIINSSITLYAIWKIVPGDVETKVSTDKIDIVMDEENVNDIILSEEEKKFVEEGKNIKIDVIVNDISEQVSVIEKETIKEKVKDKNIGAYIDISIIKTIEGEGSTPITNTSSKLKFTINIPDNLIDTNNSNRKYYIVRKHDDVVELLDTVYDPINNTLTFETDKFSTYAIAYTDDFSENKIIDNQTKNPSTGDTGIIKWIGLFVVSVLGIVGFILYSRKNNFLRK